MNISKSNRNLIKGSSLIKFLGLVIISSSTNWTVPTGVTYFTGLCIGGGGGGSSGGRGGAGSGYIAFGTFTVVGGTTIAITIGSGGAEQSSGSTASIGSYIAANGGFTISSIGAGAAGGSGGGAAPFYYTVASGNGGSGGNNGSYDDFNGYSGGVGQGAQFWSQAFATINSATLTVSAGSGGSGVSNPLYYCAPGGGGGGGILLKGFGPVVGSGIDPNCTSAGGGVDYGAGGASSTFNYNTGSGRGGSGAPGVCVIKWD